LLKRALLEKLALAPWASRRRQELLELLDRLNPTIGSDGTQAGDPVVLDVAEWM
jgi:hypothetical protein